MRALITGAGGQLGRELLRTAPAATTVLAYGRDQLDVTDPADVASSMATAKPDLVINAAAYNAVDRAEEESELAFAVNAAGAENVADASVRQGARLVQISTDFVFDGSQGRPYEPGDSTGPLGVYGASKLEGERRVAETTGDRALILRTAWLYSVFGNNFVKTILGAAAAGNDLEVVSDQVGTPTWGRSLAVAIWKAAALPEVTGIHHWTDAGVASWYDFALAIIEEGVALGLLGRGIPVREIASQERPTLARRPANSLLRNGATCRALGLEPRHWRTNLRRMLTELKDRRDG